MVEDDGSRRRHRRRRPARGGPGRARRPRGVGPGRRQPAEQRLEVHADRTAGASRCPRRPTPKYVYISVSDNGLGIAAGEQKLIFDKFQRGAAARERRRAGAGLGLALVRAIVRRPRGAHRRVVGGGPGRPLPHHAPPLRPGSGVSDSGGGASGRDRRGRRGHRRGAGAQPQAPGLPHRGGRRRRGRDRRASRSRTRTWSCSTSRCPSGAASGCSRPCAAAAITCR